jgi:hypothetical protein
MSIANLTPSTLRQAAALKEQIEALEQQLAAVLSGGEIPAVVATAVEPAPAKARRGRPRKTQLPVESEPAKTAPVKRRRISAAGRAAMAAAAKARWAKAKASQAA